MKLSRWTALASLLLAAPMLLTGQSLIEGLKAHRMRRDPGTSRFVAEPPRENLALNPDTTGNATLNGTYFARQILFSDIDGSTGRPKRARSVNGLLLLDGKGGYQFTGRLIDTSVAGKSNPYQTSGTYGVSSSGMLNIQSLIDSKDVEFGGVGAAGPSAIVASATEGGYQDLFVAIPANGAVTLATLNGTYRAVYIDYLQGDVGKVRDAGFTLTADGKGNAGPVNVSGFAADQGSTALSQTVTSVPYVVSATPGPFASLNFGAASPAQLISGSKMTVISPDGNLILGLDPDGYDLLFATRPFTGTNAAAGYSGMYYFSTLSIDNSLPKTSTITSNYGSINATGGGVALVHQRLFEADLFQPAVENTYANEGLTFDTNGSLQVPAGQEFLGAGGQTLLGVGGDSFYSVFIGLQLKAPTPKGVFIYPTAVVNSANFAPITNAIAPGEYVTLYGVGLASDVFPRAGDSLPSPLPTLLAGVQVTVNGRNAPLYVVAPSQISFIVPYATTEAYAQIQVNNNGATSNTVSVRVNLAAPGVWTAGANGISVGRVQKAQDYSLISETNPVKPGDTIIIYCTGLGAVTPAVADGAAAGSSPLSQIPSGVWVYVDGVAVRPSFAGLAPGFAGLYQINATVPKRITQGSSVALDLEVRDRKDNTVAYNSEAKLPIAAPAGAITATVAPDPVTVSSSDGKWHYGITLQETGGVGVTIKTMSIGSTESTSRIAEFFGGTHIAANGKLVAGVVSSGVPVPVDQTWRFTGVDDNGAGISWTAIVHFR